MEYKGFYIDCEFYSCISAQYCGDDVIFGSVEEAKEFIDIISET